MLTNRNEPLTITERLRKRAVSLLHEKCDESERLQVTGRITVEITYKDGVAKHLALELRATEK